MKKIGLLYWPKKGNVESCANLIYKKFKPEEIEICSIDQVNTMNFDNYQMLIVGCSTVGADVWQGASDTNLWFDFFTKFTEKNLKGKPVAIFGLGDQVLYPDHFVDGMMLIKNEFDRVGAKLIGKWPTDGYDFTHSESIENGVFVGLALDEDQQDELTNDRIDVWVKQLKEEANL